MSGEVMLPSAGVKFQLSSLILYSSYCYERLHELFKNLIALLSLVSVSIMAVLCTLEVYLFHGNSCCGSAF